MAKKKPKNRRGAGGLDFRPRYDRTGIGVDQFGRRLITVANGIIRAETSLEKTERERREQEEAAKLMRSCGECTACCWSLRIDCDALQKEPFCKCEHVLDGKGCAIYNDRPKPCRDFVCSWINEPTRLAEEDRPDKSGVIFYMANDMAIQAREAWLDSLVTDKAKALIDRVSKQFPVAIINNKGERRLVGPEAALEKIKEIQKRRKTADVEEQGPVTEGDRGASVGADVGNKAEGKTEV